jgi:hypothetical protein
MTTPPTVIRKRERVDSSPPSGMSQTWTEYQVVIGRKIVGRYGSVEAALKDYPNAQIDITAQMKDKDDR